RVLHDSGRERGRRLAGTALTALGAALVLLTIAVEAGVAIAYWVRPSHTLALTMIMLPYLVLICLTAFAGGMLNALNRFAAPAAAPIVLNLVLIAVVCVGGTYAGLAGLDLLYMVAIGVVIAGLGQFGLQIVAMIRAGFRPVLNCDWRDADLRRTLTLMAPMVVGLSATQFNVVADKLIAFAFIADGRGPSVLGYAHMPYHLPVAVFGIAIATAIFPLLSRHAAREDRVGLARSVERGLGLSIFVAAPATVGLMLVASPLCSLLYERGEFDAVATSYVARTLVAYAFGLVAYSALQIVVRAYYAFQDTRTPVLVGVTVLALNVALDFVLVFPMAEAGLALASAISVTVQAVWLTWALARRLPEMRWSGLLAGAGRCVAASLVMGLVIWAVLRPEVLGGQRPYVQLLAAIPAGVLVYAGAARLLRCPELVELLGSRPRPSEPQD
ncbi:MAG: murein biosynthesis integral membrane protein MurJ, partial [Planctomycetes bacterium]|nr:murein biosynthesis integral membrane protein MurJ [Planctomycetota bacterium]